LLLPCQSVDRQRWRERRSPSACSSWRDMLQILVSSSCLQVSTKERYSRGWKHIISKILLLDDGKQKEAQVWRESCSKMVLGFSPRPNLSVGLFFLMPGGSELHSHESWYVTRIFLAAVLEGWATQSPISQEFF
jgi:hypothetical protein